MTFKEKYLSQAKLIFPNQEVCKVSNDYESNQRESVNK